MAANSLHLITNDYFADCSLICVSYCILSISFLFCVYKCWCFLLVFHYEYSYKMAIGLNDSSAVVSEYLLLNIKHFFSVSRIYIVYIYCILNVVIYDRVRIDPCCVKQLWFLYYIRTLVTKSTLYPEELRRVASNIGWFSLNDPISFFKKYLPDV